MSTTISELYPYLSRFSTRSGPIRWSPADFEGAAIPDDIAPAIVAASQVEGETYLEVAKARRAGLLRDADLAVFFPMWMAEESEHGRALRYVAELNRLAPASVPPRWSLPEYARYRAAPIGAFVSRLLPSNAILFLGIGVGAEHVTRTLYRHLAARVSHDGLKRFLYRVAAQEARHLTFFREAAKARPSPSPAERAMLRRLLIHGWRPVGMDRLGAEAWCEVFQPLLEDQDARRELQRMDDVLDALPLFSGLHLMERFLTSISALPPESRALASDGSPSHDAGSSMRSVLPGSKG